MPKALERAYMKSGRLRWLIERYNTVLPDEARPTERVLHDLRMIPRMSTFAIAAIVNRGVSHMPDDQAFVTVGIWHGFLLLASMINHPEKICIGIDDFSEFGGPREAFAERFSRFRGPKHRFYDMDYRAYFASVHRGPIGFYLYDAAHDYEDQLLGLRIAEPFFAKGCLVLVDDTNALAPRRATLDFLATSRHRYEMILDRTTAQNRHPTFWNGIMLFERVD